MAGDRATHSYNRREVRRLARVTERQLKSWEQKGLIAEQDEYGYRDLIALRTLAELRRNRVSTPKIREAISALREKLGEISDPLTELRLFSEGRDIRVQIGGQTMEPVSGQLLLDFDRDALQRLLSFPGGVSGARAARERQERRALVERMFQNALELEQTGADADAIEAYRQVLELDPGFASALVNLGTLHFMAHDLDKARQYYEDAVRADARYALAHFNLGNLFDELGDKESALREYQTALELEPTYADAHYNIALLYQAAGQVLRAVRHWRTYLKLDPASSWATIARRELNRLYRETVVDSGERQG